MGNIIIKQSPGDMAQNLKSNWLWPLCAAAFFYMNSDGTEDFRWGVVIAFFIHACAAAYAPPIWGYIKSRRSGLKLLALLCSLGVCWGKSETFRKIMTPELESRLPLFAHSAAETISLLVALLSLVFVYAAVIIFYVKLKELLAGLELFDGIGKREALFYLALLAVLLCSMTAAFCKTYAFYGSDRYDVIYTSDSAMVRTNVFINLTHSENDLRQPLFAVFAAPFAAAQYLIGRMMTTFTAEAIMINLVQVLLLFTANFMLAKIMRLAPLKRACFVLLVSCTYTNLLFTIMMEQYIVGYFWLMLCIYCCATGKKSRLAFWGASGTLTTSGILVLFMPQSSPLKKPAKWLCGVLRYGAEYLLLMLAFGRFDVLRHTLSRYDDLMRFSGKGLPARYKAVQYIAYARSCFLAPSAGVFDDWAWRLSEPGSISRAGVLILALCAAGAVINRRSKSSRIAAGWLAFSFVILFVMGWGTQENGLVLYSLYFGWSFWVLLFELLDKICGKLGSALVLPAASCAAAAAMAAVNIPAFVDMLRFAVLHYPC